MTWRTTSSVILIVGALTWSGQVTASADEEPAPFVYDDTLSCLAFSPDGQWLAAGCPRGEPHVLVLDAESGERVARFETAHHTFACGLRDDGKAVFATSLGGMDRAEIWHIADRRRVASFAIPYEGSFYACRVALSPDGAVMATAGLSDGIVRLWDVGEGALLRELSGHTGAVYALRFSADGRRVASAGSDGTARVWTVAGGDDLLRVATPGEPVVDVAFHRDGRRLVTAGGHGSVVTWTIDVGERVAARRIAGVPESSVFDMFEPLPVALSADGTAAVGAVPGALVHVSTDGEGEPVRIATEHPFPFAVSPDGMRLVARDPGASATQRRLRVFDVSAHLPGTTIVVGFAHATSTRTTPSEPEPEPEPR